MTDGTTNQIDPLFKSKQRMFALILSNGDDNTIEQFDRALNDIEVSVGQWIKASRIDRRAHGVKISKPPYNDEQEKARWSSLFVWCRTGCLAGNFRRNGLRWTRLRRAPRDLIVLHRGTNAFNIGKRL